ncbi:unnamed protein product [Candida verbasci]|uniref:E3 ubiquitin-protein ligase listerin n=1 Tax=Candida verbasci TaxID=1227364 RepID=A0A9W4TTS8_9ASCO|nr:unnamed protein product [Candida verbasci]
MSFDDLGYNDFSISLNYFTSLPDISSLTDSNEVVLFKSLLKKESKTKEKALNVLLSSNIDESTFIAWLQLYPKLAIDNSKSVRLLSHQVHSSFLNTLGSKIFTKYLKSFIPIWLLGIYDNDKSVCNTSYKLLLELFKNDQEKYDKLWDLFNEQILNLIGNVICVEVPESLSDQRYTNDSDIIMKYDRVLNSCVNMLMKIYKQDDETIYKILSFDPFWDNLSTSLKPDTLNLTLVKSLLDLISVVLKYETKLFKLIVKKFFKIKLKFKQNIIFSRVIVPFWETILSITSYESKKTVWDGKESKFYEFLKVGPCNTTRLHEYYDIIFKLLNKFKQQERVIDFSNDEEYIFTYNILFNQFKTAFGDKFWSLKCLLKVNALFDKDYDELLSEVLPIINERNKDSIESAISINYNEKMGKYLTKISKEDHAAEFTQILIDVLSKVGLIDLIEEIVEKALENVDEDKVKSFKIIKTYLLHEYKPNLEVVSFLQELPSFVEQDFIEEPLELLKIAIKQEYLEDQNETVSDFYLKLSIVAPSKIDHFITSININLEVEKYPEIYNYLIEKSKNDPSDLDLLCSTKDKTIIENVAQSTTNSKEFNYLVNKYNLLSMIDNDDGILQDAWISKDEKILLELRSNQDKYFRSLIKYLESRSLHDEIHIDFIESGPLPIDDIKDRVKKSLSLVNVEKVAVSNPLDTGIYLCKGGENPKIDEFIPILAKVLTSLKDLPKEWEILVYVIKEYLNDYIFTQDLDEVEDVMEIADSITLRTITWSDLDFDEFSIQNDMYSFYIARVLKKIVETSLESENSSSFESKSINYVELVKNPLKFYAITSGISKFISSKSIDRVKNYIFSEILSVKLKNCNTDGLKWITLTFPFFDDSKLRIPAHKLNMILNHIKSWFPVKGAILYGDETTPSSKLMVQIIRFVTLLNKSDEKPEILDDFIHELYTEMVVNSKLDTIYYTLKLYNTTPDTLSSIMEYTLSESYTSDYTQVNQLIERTLETVLIRKPVNIGKETWLLIFLNTKSEIIQRVCTWYLEKIISQEQQDLVIEYQLSKDEIELKLPVILLDIIESGTFQFQYFSAWYLIFAQLKDITFRMRNDYIKQIEQQLPILFDNLFQFSDKSKLDTFSILETESLEQFAIYLYCQSVLYCSNQVQIWFKEIRDRQLKSRIEKFTTKQISPILIDKIMQQVSKEKDRIQGKEENMTIKLNLNEIKSTYIVDEQKMEMIIKIPSNYPLDNIVVDGPLRLGVKENQWKAWLLASQKIISLTNGSIIDSIELFCKNVNLHFSGFEDCAICYSILHQDLSLPSKTCSTCSNKFHAACLYKWFKSSGSSTCPLCRSPFNFKK